MRLRTSWLVLAAALGVGVAGRTEAFTCEGASVDYTTSVIQNARYCLTRQVPRNLSCMRTNRRPNTRGARVDALCPAGSKDRLACTARQAILAAGFAYDSLTGTGFAHLCTGSSCGNGITEPGEQCDDANVQNGDGCSATCQLEGGACNDVCAGVVPVSGTSIKSQRIASGLTLPLFVAAPPRDVSRIFVIEKPGRIRIIKWGALLPTAFLDISAKVSTGGEQGLLGLAFHPNYVSNGRFFVNYTDTSGNTVVAEYHVSANPDVADTTESLVLGVTQPFANHNGGDIMFGPDGYLYIGMGDGGGAGDTLNNAQNPASLLGKMLRISVDGAAPYTIPPTNPFAGAGDPLDEIWALGMRNPWRYSFDRLNGDLYIGDVGQNLWEEIDYQPGSGPGSNGGDNYGWHVVEGNGHCFNPSSGCDQTGLKLPILDYPHSQGCSVTGGYVYRGCKMPDLRGTYFYADYCTNFIRTFQVVAGAATNLQDRAADLAPGGGLNIRSISSFGEDARGELYLCDIIDGEVFKIIPGP